MVFGAMNDIYLNQFPVDFLHNRNCLYETVKTRCSNGINGTKIVNDIKVTIVNAKKGRNC